MAFEVLVGVALAFTGVLAEVTSFRLPIDLDFSRVTLGAPETLFFGAVAAEGARDRVVAAEVVFFLAAVEAASPAFRGLLLARVFIDDEEVLRDRRLTTESLLERFLRVFFLGSGSEDMMCPDLHKTVRGSLCFRGGASCKDWRRS